MAKKKIGSKVQFMQGNEKEPKQLEAADHPQTEAVSAGPQPDAPQPSATSSQSRRSTASKRSVCAMHKVLAKKAQGKKMKVRYNEIGVPVGDCRHNLQSYIGMLARTMVPIDVPSWPQVDPEIKNKIWSDIEATFKVPPELEKTCLQSAGAKWRQFKANLTNDYVIPYSKQKKRLAKPPKQYAYVGKEPWKRFVATRLTPEWRELNKKQRQRVQKRKYPHRLSRTGYVGLVEREVSLGHFEPGEVPDRAVLWKLARKKKKNMDADANVDVDADANGDEDDDEEGLTEICKRIDDLIEMKHKGEFKPAGAKDVLTEALQSPEHSGRVRGVGSFVSPTTYFNLPKGQRIRITKAELLARDKKREEEFKKKAEEFDKTAENLKSEIAELKTLIGASNLNSPMLSDKASCRGGKEVMLDGGEEDIEAGKLKNKSLDREFMVEDDAIINCPPVGPSSPGKKGPRKCELAVDTIDNIVAFGMVFDDKAMGSKIHGSVLKPGHLRVSVDGIIKPDALVPVPIAGEIEVVQQALGSHLAWPKDLIVISSACPKIVKNKKGLSNDQGELRRVQKLFNSVKLNKNVPDRFKMLYKHASCFMKETGQSIQIPCDSKLFGIERTIFLLHENIIALSEFNMVGQAIISSYMAYLQTVIHEKKIEDSCVFLDPSRYKLNEEFEAYVAGRLDDGALRVHLMPYNKDFHWILVLICESEIFILNPLSHQTHFPQLEQALMGAVRSYNSRRGRVIKNPKIVNLLGAPKQPGGTECGYVVMRYMRDIIEDKEMKFMKAWANRTRKAYTREDLDIVRMETLGYIEGFM